MAWDLVKPPRDRGGEAPEFEKNELRSKFKSEFKSARVKFVGITKDNWWKSKKWKTLKWNRRIHILLIPPTSQW